jgi:perosamine synthetase
MPDWSPHPRYRLYTRPASYLLPLATAANAIEQFEAEVCRKFSVAAAVCVPMARTGIYFTLLETIRPGQKVVMSPLTIVDVVNAVLLAGGIPVFADISRESCALSTEQAESLIDSQTGAILLTHLHGQTAGTRAFREISTRRGIPLIEDAAQAFGAVEDGKYLGTIGDAGIYSFGFFKHLTTWRGGMVVSNDRALIDRIRSRVRTSPEVSRRRLLAAGLSGLMVDIGTWPPLFSRFAYPIVQKNMASVNRRLDPEAGRSSLKAFPDDYLRPMRPWQALLGLQQLDRIEADCVSRLTRAAEYHRGLEGFSEVIKPLRKEDRSNIYTYFPVHVPNRRRVLLYSQKRGRDFAAQHLRNCADLPEFREFYRDCPKARATSAELILLPTYPRYPLIEVKRNIEILREFLECKTSFG